MARGFLRGALWGAAASLCAAGVASVVVEGPTAPVVKASAPVTDDAPQPATTAAKTTSGDRVPVTGQEAPKAPAPQPDTLAAVREDTVRSAAQPETGTAALLSDPGVDSNQTVISAGTTETPVVPNPQAMGLRAPVVDAGINVSTDPAQPPEPEVTQELALSEDPAQPESPSVNVQPSGLAPEGDVAPEADFADTSISVEPVQPPLPDVASETQAFEPEPDAPTPSDTPATAEDGPAPQPAQTAVTAPSPSASDVEDDVETADISPPPLPQDAVDAPELASEDVLAGIGTPVGTFGNLAPDVQINRLPTLNDPAAQGPEEILLPEAEEDAAAEVTISERPVERFAVPHDNLDGKPVMAIVLMDEGVDLSRDTIGLPALRSFPYPISFAVDSSLPDAKERMAAYRAEGFEVLATVNLPQSAKAGDAEVSLAVALDAVPEAVGVLEGVGEGVQSSRDAARQVTEILAASGHGFVTQNKGLNTVQKLAARAGVPSAVVFRDFDSSDQTPSVIRRFLDQAAFRAGRDGAVIMLGRLREDTISALLLWGLQDRAEQVALVPVSAALTTQQ
ncbi:divergent polysaccharide deacetylase family protein [uncultured Roseobacter sp.]|uniref:divergent polysaccharide deacetylase family protein n=1 Tax=uncultured Roseobacter sp. TaxID=114847 RepID=UPI0026319A73|nr:divergent polysaccharide deacetylase family protein [uncultured Roseobacter sp.]